MIPITVEGVPTPEDLAPLSKEAILRLLEGFGYKPVKIPNMPEAIAIAPAWVAKNIRVVRIPLLDNTYRASQGIPLLRGSPRKGNVLVHRYIAKAIVSLFQAWDDLGLGGRVLTWDGSYVPRFVRGSTSVLSNHSRGLAFDINARWNMMGRTPAAVGQTGCVRELAAVAVQHGWWWGGFGWPSARTPRADGMHFEASDAAIDWDAV